MRVRAWLHALTDDDPRPTCRHCGEPADLPHPPCIDATTDQEHA